MITVVDAKKINGEVKAIASKSYAHRALICSSLSENHSFVTCKEESEDIMATVKCLESLGAVIKRMPNGYDVYPVSHGKGKKSEEMDCNESGSTFRFMLPIALALGAKSSFNLKGRLALRPLSPFYEELEKHGAKMSEEGSVPFKIDGRLEPGKYGLPGNVSSQFISGLLFALPLLSEDSKIIVAGQIESKSYINLTIEVLKLYGIDIQTTDNEYIIKGNQTFSAPPELIVEGDWSNAAFWLSAGALLEKGITCNNLNMNSMQGDKKIIDILKEFGAEVTIYKNSVTVKKNQLKGIEVDAMNIPDLVPIISLVASVSKGMTVIKNAERLRLKESDRLKSVAETLTKLGADIVITKDGLEIYGKEALKSNSVDSFKDHRIAMMTAIASIVSNGPITIYESEVISKSYPGFYAEINKLGGYAGERKE